MLTGPIIIIAIISIIICAYNRVAYVLSDARYVNYIDYIFHSTDSLMYALYIIIFDIAISIAVVLTLSYYALIHFLNMMSYLTNMSQ